MRLIEVQISYRILMLFTTLSLVIPLLVYGVMRSPSFLEVKDPLEQADGILVLSGDNLFLRTIRNVVSLIVGASVHQRRRHSSQSLLIYRSPREAHCSNDSTHIRKEIFFLIQRAQIHIPLARGQRARESGEWAYPTQQP